MIKRLSFVLALCLLLTLTSCSQLLGEALKEPDEPSPPVETPEGGDKPDPTEPEPEPEPTGVDEYGFTLWPEGNYLADKKFDTDEYLPDYDADPNFVQYVATTDFAVTSTQDTIFSFPYESSKSDNTVILFTDRATGITMPLCGRPECTHDNSDCNAYIPAWEIRGLRVYDGKLWWSHHNNKEGLVLNRMNLDGTDRETVMKLNLDFLVNLSNNTTWVIHRGYLYVGGQDDVVTDGKASCSFIVYAQPIEGGDDITILKREIASCKNPRLCMKPVGNDLYIMLQYEDIGSEDIDGIHYELFRWDSKTRKAEQLFSVCGDEYLFDSMVYPLPVPGDGVYLEALHFDREEDINTFDIYKYSFETNEIEEYSSIDLEYGVAVGLTRDHLIACTYKGDIRVYVYDHEGNLISESELLNDYFRKTIVFVGEDEDYVYFECFLDPDDRECMLALPIEGGDFLVIR